VTLATRYLGLQLAHPIVASASPLTATLDGMRCLEDAGAAAVVMSSLYEEQIRVPLCMVRLGSEDPPRRDPHPARYLSG